jgi:Predicted membrane protein (DUF2207).
MNRVVFWAIAGLILLVLPARAQTPANGEYSLAKYHVDIVVNENNSFQITEQIRAHFHVRKHGIVREIPLRNEVVRLDGTRSHTRARISDIHVEGDMYEVYVAGKNKEVQIGDPDRTITGSKDYVIRYLYNMGKDRGSDYDELYFNIIGTEWDTSIDSISFTITLPKVFDTSTLGFSSGAFGATDNDNVHYQVYGAVIEGSYSGQLSAGEALTLRLELPEGYFVNASFNQLDTMMQLSFVLPLLFVLLTFGLWFVYGRDDRVIDPVEFYPPKGYNSAETGFLYKGKADTRDVVSLLIYLANKGYIKITETREKALFSTVDGFTITKLRDYDGNNPNERLFLKGLFKLKPPAVSLKNVMTLMNNPEAIHDEASAKEVTEVSLEDLKDHFYLTLNAITSNMNKQENRESIFEKDSLNKRWPVTLMSIAAFLLITVRPVLEYHGDPFILLFLLFPALGFLILFLALFTDAFKTITVNGVPTTKRSVSLKFGLTFGLLFGGVPFAFIVLPALLLDPAYWMAFLSGISCIVVMLFFDKYMKKRTPLGNELLGQIKGFKRFLETVEKHKLEQIARQNPGYFYDILPFTYVLGISDVWIKRFESIAIKQPDWYSGSGVFNHASFGRFIDTSMRSASSAMASSPSSSGSSSSGGGSSGRGSGGGGGRSW